MIPRLYARYRQEDRFTILEQRLSDSKPTFTLILAYILILAAIVSVILPATIVMAPAVAAGLGVGGFAFLSAISYGMINDILACRDSLEYFRFGHRPGQRDEICIPSTNKNAQAFYWGILATCVLGFIGAVVIGVCAGIAAVPLNSIILPIIAVGVLSTLAIAHFRSKRLSENYSPGELDRITWLNDEVVAPIGNTVAQRNWFRCSIRNSHGYTILPLLAISLSVALIVQAAAGVALFVAIPIAAPIIPLALTIPLIIFIGGMAINYVRHKNTVDPEETLLGKFYPNVNEDNNDESDRISVEARPQQLLSNSTSILNQKGIIDTNIQSLKERTQTSVPNTNEDTTTQRAKQTSRILSFN